MYLLRPTIYLFRSYKESKTIIDPYDFRNNGIWGQVKNAYKNYSASIDAQTCFKTQKVKSMPFSIKDKYHNMLRKIHSKRYNQIQNLLSAELFTQFNKKIKNKETKTLINQLHLVPVQKVTIVQIRSYKQNQISIQAQNQWFQFICCFQSESEGEKHSQYHVLEKWDKSKLIKFIKFNL